MRIKIKQIISPLFIASLILTPLAVPGAVAAATQTQAQANTCKNNFNAKVADLVVGGQAGGVKLQGGDGTEFTTIADLLGSCDGAAGGNCTAQTNVQEGGGTNVYSWTIECSDTPGKPPAEKPTNWDAGLYNITGVNEDCSKSSTLSLNWDVNNDGCTNTVDLMNMIFRLLAGLVGIAVVGGITWGGMLYATSNGNASKTQQGVTIIVNAVIGLLIFIFLFAITNFLVPGGVIG